MLMFNDYIVTSVLIRLFHLLQLHIAFYIFDWHESVCIKHITQNIHNIFSDDIS